MVIAQLVAHARTSERLRTDHKIDLMDNWLGGNGAHCDWLERIELGRLLEELAPQFLTIPDFTDSAALAKLFIKGWRLDYGSPITRGIYEVCEGHLQKSELSSGAPS
ncbi:hypothetical protein WN982_01090 [Paraburkholderia sp. IMGN_8]|uniref:hypothetical protein n=1 Tax=Paraburkholderia sp. IMGN_8 TaxID=3136564 RepID=UPI003100D717